MHWLCLYCVCLLLDFVVIALLACLLVFVCLDCLPLSNVLFDMSGILFVLYLFTLVVGGFGCWCVAVSGQLLITS